MDKKKSVSKKEARHQIESKIEAALINLKTVLGDKEFVSRVKKAAKIFAKGFKAESTKEEKIAVPKAKVAAPAPKAATKKAAVKKAVKKAATKK